MKKIILVLVIISLFSLIFSLKNQSDSRLDPVILMELRESVMSGKTNIDLLHTLQKQLVNSIRNQEEIVLTLGQYYSEGTWLDDFKIEYYYNINGDLDYVKLYDWDEYDEDWIYIMYQNMVYNNQHQLIEVYIGFPMDDDEYFFIVKLEFFYDINNEISYVDMYMMDFLEELWILSMREKLSYENGNLVEVLILDVEDGEFENDSLFTFEYDSNNLLIQELYQYWLFNEWENDILVINEYNSSHDIISSLEKYWDFDGAWVDWYRWFFYYDSGLLMEIIIEYNLWDDEWENDEKITYEYTTSGRAVVETFHYWTGDSWYPDYRYVDTWDFVDTEFNETISLNSGISAYNYPNPFNPNTTIVLNLPHTEHLILDVYNIRGEKVKSLFNGIKEKGIHQITWNGKSSYGNDLPSGVYIYKAETSSSLIVNKIMLIK